MSEVGIAEQKAAPLRPGAQESIAVINNLALRELLSLDVAISLVRQAMLDLSVGRVHAPERWAMPAGNGGILALMPGAVPRLGRFGIKVLSLFDPVKKEAAESGHQGLMLLFDAEKNGRPLSIIDANSLTGMRTAAASAVATDALARPDCRTLAMIGCGEQARWHVHALRCVRPIEELRIWSPSPGRVRKFSAEMEAFGMKVTASATARDAVTGADIVCTVTRSKEPVILGDWLTPGQHVNLVGSSTRASRELDEIGVARGRFVVDSRPHALSQGGELRAAIAAGLVSTNHVHAEIGEVLAGNASGRLDRQMITIYKSLGHVAQDLALAMAAAERAAESAHTTWAAW